MVKAVKNTNHGLIGNSQINFRVILNACNVQNNVKAHYIDHLYAGRNFPCPLKEYSSLQDNPYNVRCIHTGLIVRNYFAPWGVVNVLISESNYCTACALIAPGGCHDGTHLAVTSLVPGS